MKKIHQKIIFLLFSVTTSVCFADNVSNESLDKILELSGVSVQVKEFPKQIKVGVEASQQQASQIEQDKLDLMLKMIDSAILPKNMLSGIKTSLQQTMTEQDIQKLLLWYESKLGKEITQAEERLSTEEGFKEMIEAGDSLFENEARVAFAKRLDELLGLTKSTLDYQEATSLAVYTAMMTSLRPEEDLDLAGFQAQKAMQRRQLYPATQQIVLASLLYSYQNVDMAKLQKYEAFLKTPHALEFNKNAMMSMSNEFINSTSRFARGMAAIVQRQETGA